MGKASASTSRRSRDNSFRKTFAGGQDEQPCDVKSSTTTGRSAAIAATGDMAATGDKAAINPMDMTKRDSMAILLGSVHAVRGKGAHCYAADDRTLTRNLEDGRSRNSNRRIDGPAQNKAAPTRRLTRR